MLRDRLFRDRSADLPSRRYDRHNERSNVSATVGRMQLKVTADGVEINGGKQGGLVLAAALRRSLESVQRYCETMRTAVAAGLTGVGIGAAANGGTGAGVFSNKWRPQPSLSKIWRIKSNTLIMAKNIGILIDPRQEICKSILGVTTKTSMCRACRSER